LLQTNQLIADRYRVLRHIADGGMGSVFEAEHVATEARVALKVLLPHTLALASERRRFELEARISARINSEHIVTVFDAGVDTHTRLPYLAMELLVGQTLAARLEQSGTIELVELLPLLRQLAHGLDAAHGYRTPDGRSQPIVHRDLKPQNLFLTRRHDGTTHLKILDFGIAKVLSDTTQVSQELRGTPLYMAYEQAAGEAITPQTDLWALGLITFSALTGRSYWPAANNPTAGAAALYSQILTLPLPLASERVRAERLPMAFPVGFDAWLMRCLMRTPSQRFATAGAAVEALAVLAEGRAARVATNAYGPSPMTTVYEPGTPAARLSEAAVERRPATLPVRHRGRQSGILLAMAIFMVTGLAATSGWRAIAWRRHQSAASTAERPPRSAAAPIDVTAMEPPSIRVRPLQIAEPELDHLPRLQAADGAPAKSSEHVAATISAAGATPGPMPAGTTGGNNVNPDPRTASDGSRGGEKRSATAATLDRGRAPPRATAPMSDAAARDVGGCLFYDPYTGRCSRTETQPAQAR
jgi:serine/threonine-protein kinase